MNKRRGFTLAEVLITLGIIGVVAAMTIPTLISKYQKQEYVTRLKKAYAQTTEALKLMAKDHGCVNDLKCTGIFDVGTDNETLGTEFIKYFKIAKDCGTNVVQTCFSNSVSDYHDGINRYDLVADGGDPYTFVTVDGNSMYLYNNTDNCTGSNGVCASVIFDINGPDKGPNNTGRDIFLFYITNNHGAQLYPVGAHSKEHGGLSWKDLSFCDQDNTFGRECAGRIMDEGWEMNY